MSWRARSDAGHRRQHRSDTLEGVELYLDLSESTTDRQDREAFERRPGKEDS